MMLRCGALSVTPIFNVIGIALRESKAIVILSDNGICESCAFTS
jgi:hypothetical protein